MNSLEELFEHLNESDMVEVSGYPYPMLWSKELGIGHLPLLDSPENDSVYDREYFDKYVEMSKTFDGFRLNMARQRQLRFSFPYTTSILDVGIGSGMFCDSIGADGTDVNPYAVRWLKENGKLAPEDEQYQVITMWDVLEHIPDPTDILSRATRGLCISMPIYRGIEHIMVSKHLRINEHCWYFTNQGIKNYLKLFGFNRVLLESTIESDICREDILSYTFAR